ncbi:MAG: DUF192 domain-containing protein [Deltaproteobacteria bacterium]|nr:DUF192 domain-containing protein [Deltaproteobacteria bacterium]
MMKVSRNLSAWVIAGLLLAALGGLAEGEGGDGGQEVSEHGNPWVRVTVGKVTVQAEAVRTSERLYLGLSYRSELPEGRGMLFFMPAKEVQTFCMRGMRLPLDLIWIGEGRVAGLTRNVPPTFPGNLTSPAPVDHVLEVPGGFADRHGIKAGDRVRWQ